MPIFAEQADILVCKLKPFVGQGCIDVFPFMSCCSLDAVCGKQSVFLNIESNHYPVFVHFVETTMGVKVDAQVGDSKFVTWLIR